MTTHIEDRTGAGEQANGTWQYDHSPFRVARQINDKTIAKSAEDMAVGPATYQRYERGDEAPRTDDLVKFCNANGINPATFFRRK